MDVELIDGLPPDQHEFGMVKGHSPIADKVAAIDFDGTIVPWGPLMADKDPEPGAVEAIKAIKAAGYKIVILTSRMSRTWAISVVGENEWDISRFLRDQHVYVSETLIRHDIPYDEITAEKVPFEFLIDDKAYRYERNWSVTKATAIANAKGGLFYVYWARRGHRVHRISGLWGMVSERNERGWRHAREVREGEQPRWWQVDFACGNIERYVWAHDDDTPMKVVARLMDQGRIVTDFRQPTCMHCAKAKAESWTPET